MLLLYHIAGLFCEAKFRSFHSSTLENELLSKQNSGKIIHYRLQESIDLSLYTGSDNEAS